MDKPTKPSNLIPRSFGGTKNNFSASLQSTGYEDGVPAIYGGDNLNYQLDATGKELDYCEKICDYINAIPINKTPIVDANNKLVYTQYDIRVYNATETYYENDYLSGFVNGAKHIYRCKQDNVIGQSLSDDTYFEQVDIMGNVKTIGRNIGETIFSLLPLTDVGLHLIDGALISGSGSYSAFVDYIADLYEADPTASYFAQPTYKTFVQPILTGNGTLGGDDFAVEASSNASNREAYKSFDGNNATKWGVNNVNNGWLTFYNPVALKVSAITYTPSTDYPSEDGGSLTISGSNDNSTWTSLWTGSYIANSVQTFNVNSSDFYNYYKIQITNGSSNWVGLGNLSIKAIENLIITPEEFWQSQVLTYGVCGKFVYDSVNNTVRLPKVTGIVEGTIDATALGDLVEAGLPNITGAFSVNDLTDDIMTPITTGAFGSFKDGSRESADGKSWNGSGIDFDASRSSSIYKDSFNKVQPQTIKGFMYIVIATTTKTDIQVDIDEIATDLNGKADVDLSNANNQAKILISNMAMPSSTYEDLTLGASGANYTAPANGYVIFIANFSSGSSYVQLGTNKTPITQVTPGTAGHNVLAGYVPVRSNDTFNLYYSSSGVSIQYFRFIYAQGSESEAL